MKQIDIHINLESLPKHSKEADIMADIVARRLKIDELLQDERYMEALEKTVASLQKLKEFPDHDNEEFRAVLVALIFDLAEIHYFLKDYKRSEKELETLFKVLDPLVGKKPERFGRLHILAMELSTRILRSRKKAIDMLKQQMLHADALADKVNAGITGATDKLVDSLCAVGRLLASAGDYREAMKFYSEAIKLSKKRAGRVNRKEIKMSLEMAEIMTRISSMRPRAERMLDAILSHAIALAEKELEADIIALKDMIKTQAGMKTSWLNIFRRK